MDTIIYALTDSHQECRNLCKIFSSVINDKDTDKPFILLDCGDLFKGIYDKDLCVNSYLKFKKLAPQCEMFITLGNNDFGFNPKDVDYLKNTIKSFENNGINFVCANLTDLSTGQYSNLVPRYKIVEIDNKKFLITGFCLNTSIMKNFGLEFEKIPECFVKLIKSIKQDYDYIIVLNHHWVDYSKELYDYAKQNNIKIDLIIGGHEHSHKEPDYQNNIYYPFAFGRTYYKITFKNKVEKAQEIPAQNCEITQDFTYDLIKYEEQTKLYKPMFKRVLNLYKFYSEPCALGTFISDNMKRIAKTDIAFHSTGFTMYSLRTDESDVITKYDFDKVICASTPIVKIKLNTQQLKHVFENATQNRINKNNGNAKFLQCSQNVEITGRIYNKTYQILQIKVNGEELLDQKQNPIDKTRTFSCATDSFIASGEQGFNMLKDIKSEPVYDNDGKEVQINKLLYNSLALAEQKYPPKSEYPTFKLIDL